MLDIRLIRDNPEAVNAALKKRSPDLSVDALLALDIERRQLLQAEESLRSQRNQLTEQIAQQKKAGQDTSPLQQQTRQLAEQIKQTEEAKQQLEERQNALLYTLPNMPLGMVPEGKSDADNPVVRIWGDEYKARLPKNPLPHWEIGQQLGILDFERGVRIAQSRFTLYRGFGAKLERALINWMLDLHTTEHGYEELLPPFLVNRASMVGTGQLPKFEEDMFRCRDDELYLIPTAEVPVTNLYRGELLEESDLPKYMTAYTPCFRREAGSAGKDTRGLMRQHQFNKVELVKLVTPETSEAEHEALVRNAERVLQLLELPYRVIELCAGDLGFSAARCYDLEVWMPGQNDGQGAYREISSCSNFLDFQARRANLKYRSAQSGKPAYLHTLNGSGLAVGRTVAAILENYQVANLPHPEVLLPAVLQPYLKTERLSALSVV